MLIGLIIFAVLALIAVVFDIGWLKTLLAVVAIIVAIVFMPGIAPVLGTMFPAFGAIAGAGSWIMSGALLLGSWMLDDEVATKVIESAGEVVEKVVEVAADTAGSLVGTFFSSPIGMLTLGVGGFILYQALSDDDESHVTYKNNGEGGMYA